MLDGVFENRGKWQTWSGAQSPVPDRPGRRLCHDHLQLLHRNDRFTLVAAESWRTHCLLVYTEPRDEEEGESEGHDKPRGTPQLSVHHSLPAQRLCHLPLCCGTQRSTVIWSPYTNSAAQRHHFPLILVFLNLPISLVGQMMSF